MTFMDNVGGGNSDDDDDNDDLRSISESWMKNSIIQ